MEIKQTIKEYIINSFLMGDKSKSLNDDDSFLEQGIIDSTGILELVDFVQDKFSIKIEDDELVPKNLDSLSCLEAFIKTKTTKA